MSWLRMNDNGQLRAELRDLNPLAVSNVVVSAGAVRRRLAVKMVHPIVQPTSTGEAGAGTRHLPY